MTSRFARPRSTVSSFHARQLLTSIAVVASAVLTVSCAGRVAPIGTPAPVVASSTPPSFLLGDFQDDYGARFTVSPNDFFQRSRNHYRIVKWDVDGQYLIARNDSLNTSDANKWTRIDWIKLNGMAPFEWAFCFTAYKAATRAEAESTPAANRDTPLTGCNRFPFSRMKRTN